MGQGFGFKINLSKLDKERIFKGEKGSYIDITVAVNDEEDKYGNKASAWQSQTKEEMLAKSDKNYLGNGKLLWDSQSQDQPKAKAKKQVEEDDDDLPF